MKVWRLTIGAVAIGAVLLAAWSHRPEPTVNAFSSSVLPPREGDAQSSREVVVQERSGAGGVTRQARAIADIPPSEASSNPVNDVAEFERLLDDHLDGDDPQVLYEALADAIVDPGSLSETERSRIAKAWQASQNQD